MPLGPGKYDRFCSDIRTQVHARGVMVIVFDGVNGSGFSVQADAELTLRLPEILEQAAAQIRASFDKGRL